MGKIEEAGEKWPELIELFIFSNYSAATHLHAIRLVHIDLLEFSRLLVHI